MTDEVFSDNLDEASKADTEAAAAVEALPAEGEAVQAVAADQATDEQAQSEQDAPEEQTAETTEDEDTGVKKFSPQTIYVNAPSTKEADRMLRQHMSSSVTEWEIKSIAETKVLGVLGYKQ